MLWKRSAVAGPQRIKLVHSGSYPEMPLENGLSRYGCMQIHGRRDGDRQFTSDDSGSRRRVPARGARCTRLRAVSCKARRYSQSRPVAGARQGGATILERTPVARILVEKGRFVGVITSHGTVRAEKAVISTGLWTRDMAADLNWSVPLQAAEHFYVVTEAIPDLPHDMPTIRDMDARVYAKADAGKLLVGFFEHNGKPWGMDGIPHNFSFDSLPEDFDHIEPLSGHEAHAGPGKCRSAT